MAPIQVADSVYYVGTEGLSSFLFVSQGGHLLIDPTLDENVDHILQNVAELGFDPQDIEVVLTTHAHWDHVAGAARLTSETGAELWVSREDAPFVRAGRDFGFESDGYPPAQVSRELRDGEVVSLGSHSLRAMITAGHTPGCTTWTGVVHVRGEPRSFVLVCSLSVLDLYRLSGENPTYVGQAEDFCSSVAKLRSLDADILLSNHGGFFDLERKAAEAAAGNGSVFVDPGELTRFLDDAERRIDRGRERQGLRPCGG